MRGPVVLGVDFGTDSVRTVIVDTGDGNILSDSVKYYSRWMDGKYCDPTANQFRQHPLDYIESFEASVKEALSIAPEGVAARMVGIGLDTTGSTPCAVDRNGTPLALKPEFADNPNGMFILWRDHTAVVEAGEINHVSKNWGGEDYTKYEGGVYSSEWFWAKILHVIRHDTSVRNAAFSWVEHCDWFPALLTRNTNPLTLKRSRCAAGHKAMWHSSWDGLPPNDFFINIDPLLNGIRDRLYHETHTADISAGTLSPEWAERLSLPQNIHVSVGAFDAHLGAVGAEIEPYQLCKVMGTTTCDMMVAPKEEIGDKLVRGICGQVDGSIIPGLLGLEAGQSAFGDAYAWFRQVLMYPFEQFIRDSELASDIKEKIIEQAQNDILSRLSEDAAKFPDDSSAVLALDWMNGRRTPDANQLLKGAITGINLGTDAVRIFKAIVEATAFGALAIVERFKSEGVPILGVIGLGGVAKKNPFVMQVVTDVLNVPIRIVRSLQVVALGSAMAAATASGIYPTIQAAQKAMGNGFEKTYYPNSERAAEYRNRYENYKKLGRFIETQLL